MEFKIELFPKKHLYVLLSKIIQDNGIKNYNELLDEFQKYKKNGEGENYYISASEVDGMLQLFTVPLSSSLRNSNKDIDCVVHQMKYALLDKDTLLPIFYIDKHLNYNNKGSYYNDYVKEYIEDIDFLHSKDVNINIYRNYIGEYVVLFFQEDNWYIYSRKHIIKYSDAIDMCDKIFIESFSDKMNLEELDNTCSHHFVLCHYRLNKPVIYPQWGSEFNEIIYLRSQKKYTLESVENEMPNKFTHNKEFYQSCIDELDMTVKNINVSDNIHRKLTSRGYIIKISLPDRSEINDRDIYIDYDTDLYTNISSYFNSDRNVHQVHLELYQKDKLNDILPYITQHYTDIVRRINISLKTLSREILNIYFLTRNQKHQDLYEVLPEVYKETLFNLHKIFIIKRDHDMSHIDKDGIMEKRSLNVDNVYNYLKNTNIDTLVGIYINRKNVIECVNRLNINEQIMFNACINTLTQSQLMKNK